MANETSYTPMPIAGTTVTNKTRENGRVPATFDAFLYKPRDSGTQLKLSLKLRIFLRQLPPRWVPLVLDADDKPFWTKPWTTADWGRFVGGVTRQANMWNNKFWLIPPDTFTDFDQTYTTFPGQVWRPHIRCTLDVDFGASSDAHRTIDVANLNAAMISSPAGPGTFRSHALLYDSLDAIPWLLPYGSAGPNVPTVHYVIAHEIGHAIGLGHIGSLLKTPLCQFAIAAERAGFRTPMTDGGHNSAYCYGDTQGKAIAGNIMGAGDSFTVENARPWLWAMTSIRQRQWEAWRAVTTDPGPGLWAKKK